MSKIFISTTLDDNQKYFPGILPFYFRIYNFEINGNEVVSSIEKKSQFSKKTQLVKTKTTLTDLEKVFLEQASEWNNKHYYFAKWTLFPIFLRTEGTFSIRFFFVETMMRKRTMYSQYDFNTETLDLITFNQRSGQIQS